MVEDIRLDALVECPSRVRGEYVDLDRKALRGGRELAHEEGKTLMDLRMAAKISDDVCPKGADVREAARVHGRIRIARVHGILRLELRQLPGDVLAEQHESTKPGYLLGR